MISSLTFLLISNMKQIAHPVPCFLMHWYSHWLYKKKIFCSKWRCKQVFYHFIALTYYGYCHNTLYKQAKTLDFEKVEVMSS